MKIKKLVSLAVLFCDVLISTAAVPHEDLDLSLVPPVVNTRPGPEYQDEVRTGAMILGMDRTPQGRIWACWTGTGDNAEAYFILATSDDDGATWSKPRVVIDPKDTPGKPPVKSFVGNLWTDPTGRLWLFFDQGLGMFDGRAGDWFITCDNPDAAEPVWSKPVRFADGCTLNKPTVLKNGEWLLPVSLWHRQHINPPLFKDEYHELDSQRMAHVYVSTNHGQAWTRRGGVVIPETSFDEHMIVELRDGRLWMLARTKYGMAETFSTDSGRTWSTPQPSAIKNVSARFFLRRLASGRLLLVKNGPIDQRLPGRSQMSAFLSDDDGKTWSGGLMLDERDGVSYPDGFQSPDGLIHILYDRNRHTDAEILLAKFREEDVLAGKFISPDARSQMLANKATGKKTAAKPSLPPLTGEPAEVEVLDKHEADTFQTGVKLFLDRAYTLKEAPAWLLGKPFLRGSIERMSFCCTKAGVVTLLTPDPANPAAASLAKTLEAQGFIRVAEPKPFQLFGTLDIDRGCVYQKRLECGEEYRLGKYALLVNRAGHGADPALASKKKVYVLLFGGQSNALGWGYQQYLEDTGDPLRLPQADVEMFYEFPGEGYLPEDTLLPLQSGNSNPNVKPLPNHYPALTNAPISRFGPELSFARTVRDRITAPDTKVVVIKFAMGGSTLWKTNDWLPDGTTNSATDGHLYRIFQACAWRGIAAVKKKYPEYSVEVLGMGWVQGESDALDGKGAEYQKHLTDFIADVRATFGTNLTFVLSKISPNQVEGSSDKKRIQQWELVRTAQAAVAVAVPRVMATETTGPAYAVSKGFSEGQFHYTTPALLQIGRDLGNALVAASGLENQVTNSADKKSPPSQ